MGVWAKDVAQGEEKKIERKAKGMGREGKSTRGKKQAAERSIEQAQGFGLQSNTLSKGRCRTRPARRLIQTQANSQEMEIL